MDIINRTQLSRYIRFDYGTPAKAISLRQKKMPAVETIQSAGQMPMPCAVSWILRF